MDNVKKKRSLYVVELVVGLIFTACAVTAVLQVVARDGQNFVPQPIAILRYIWPDLRMPSVTACWILAALALTVLIGLNYFAGASLRRFALTAVIALVVTALFTAVNGARILTPRRRMNADPLVAVDL